MSDTHYIAIDWGSSSFRAFLLDANDQLIDTRRTNNGVLNLQTPFIDILKSSCQSWLQEYSIDRIIMAGAIGSREGWVETEYAPHTSLFNGYKKYAKKIDTELDCRVEILSGLQGPSPDGSVDVMRGEELQLLGLLPKLRASDSIVCLPGTHTKWAHIRDGQIQTFASYLTGELFALLQQNTNSLGNLISSQDFDPDAFLQGAREQQQLSKKLAHPVSLLHGLFSMRAKILTKNLHTCSEYSYLSGLLVAQEIESAKSLFNIQQEVILVSDQQLASAYIAALNQYDLKIQTYSSKDCFLRGIINYKNQ